MDLIISNGAIYVSNNNIIFNWTNSIAINAINASIDLLTTIPGIGWVLLGTESENNLKRTDWNNIISSDMYSYLTGYIREGLYNKFPKIFK